MSAHRRRTDIVADPSFAAAPGDLDTTTLRSRRRLCLEIDRELSYQRRLLHGRLDLIDFELRRRRGDATGTVLESLVEILDDAPGTAGRSAPDTLVTDPGTFEGPGRRDVDLVLADDAVSRLGELTDPEIADARARIEAVERVISAQRKVAHDAEAVLAAELAERYRAGAISTDELITG
jgi:hypothetical protein